MTDNPDTVSLDNTVENSLFVEIFGNHAVIRILDVLLRHEYADFSIEELEERTNLTSSEVQDALDNLDKIGAVTRTDEQVSANSQNGVVSHLSDAQLKLTDYY